MILEGREAVSSALQSLLGESQEADKLEQVSNIMDTYDNISSGASGITQEDFDKEKARADKAEADYKGLFKMYQDRFFKGVFAPEPKAEEEEKPLTFDSLFV